MARGLPAVWSVIFGLPLIGVSGYISLNQPSESVEIYPPEAILGLFSGDVSSLLIPTSSPLAFFGFAIIFVGIYIQVVSPSAPSYHGDEELIDTRTPSQRVAITKMIIGTPVLLIGCYLLFFTEIPYVYPTVAFVIGLYYFSSGIKTYWANTLTTYYITTDRIISNYRFLSLKRKELPLNKVRGVEEKKSITETLVGLGNIRIASGGGGGSVQVNIYNINNSTEFADEIRDIIR